MGAVLAIAGVGSASISKKLDKALYGDGDRGCNGKKSKSFTKARIKDCKLRPGKATTAEVPAGGRDVRGRHEITQLLHTQLVPSGL